MFISLVKKLAELIKNSKCLYHLNPKDKVTKKMQFNINELVILRYLQSQIKNTTE